MTPMCVCRPQWHGEQKRREQSACVEQNATRQTLFLRAEGIRTTESSDAFLTTTLLPAMRAAAPLCVEGTISPRLYQSLTAIQDIFACWDEKNARVTVKVEALQAPKASSGRGVGCFFSGGVDSFYTFLKHQDEITHLVFVHGFDLPLRDTALRPRVAEALRQAAAELGKPLLEVETNLREFLDRSMNWVFTHGTALASVAQFLSGTLRTLYVPASNTYANLFPTGSHPILDPLWSTEAMEIVHDGCEANRVEKVARIAKSDTALRWLRVCWENPGSTYNCGRCEKCQRTMINLYLAGAQERCPTFDQPIDPARVARFPAWTTGVRIHAEENLRALEQAGRDPQLQRALRDFLALKHHRGWRRWIRGARHRASRLLTPSAF